MRAAQRQLTKGFRLPPSTALLSNSQAAVRYFSHADCVRSNLLRWAGI